MCVTTTVCSTYMYVLWVLCTCIIAHVSMHVYRYMLNSMYCVYSGVSFICLFLFFLFLFQINALLSFSISSAKQRPKRCSWTCVWVRDRKTFCKVTVVYSNRHQVILSYFDQWVAAEYIWFTRRVVEESRRQTPNTFLSSDFHPVLIWDTNI